MAKEKLKKKSGFLRIYAWILAFVSVVVLAYVFVMLYFIPTRGAGEPILGYRLEGLEEIEQSWITETEAFGNGQAHVDEVDIFHTGLVVYFNVRVENGTTLSQARSAAEAIGEFFIDVSDGVAEDYDLQFVVSYGDLTELREDNQEAMLEHVARHRMNMVEEILVFAEQYQTEENIIRARGNLDVFGSEFPEDVRADFESRYENLSPMTEEQEEALRERSDGNLPVANVEQNIPQSAIADFPNWGTWVRNGVIWN